MITKKRIWKYQPDTRANWQRPRATAEETRQKYPYSFVLPSGISTENIHNALDTACPTSGPQSYTIPLQYRSCSWIGCKQYLGWANINASHPVKLKISWSSRNSLSVQFHLLSEWWSSLAYCKILHWHSISVVVSLLGQAKSFSRHWWTEIFFYGHCGIPVPVGHFIV